MQDLTTKLVSDLMSNHNSPDYIRDILSRITLDYEEDWVDLIGEVDLIDPETILMENISDIGAF